LDAAPATELPPLGSGTFGEANSVSGSA
jgi:hypothetical protein